MNIRHTRILGLLALPLIVAFSLLIFGCEGITQKVGELPEGAEQLTLPEEEAITEPEEEGLRISNDALSPGIYKIAYSDTIAGEGGSGNYAITVEGLPSGLTFAENTISGTPEEVGNFPLDMQLTDSDTDESVQKSLDLFIYKETPIIIVNKKSPDIWMPIPGDEPGDKVEEEENVKLFLKVAGTASGYTWSLVDAPSSICITTNISDMWDEVCNHPLGSSEESNKCYIYKTSLSGTDMEFKVKVESPYSNPVEKTIKFVKILI